MKILLIILEYWLKKHPERIREILDTDPESETNFCIYKEFMGEEMRLYCTCNRRLCMMESLISESYPNFWDAHKRLLTTVAKQELLRLDPNMKEQFGPVAGRMRHRKQP